MENPVLHLVNLIILIGLAASIGAIKRICESLARSASNAQLLEVLRVGESELKGLDVCWFSSVLIYIGVFLPPVYSDLSAGQSFGVLNIVALSLPLPSGIAWLGSFQRQRFRIQAKYSSAGISDEILGHVRADYDVWIRGIHFVLLSIIPMIFMAFYQVFVRWPVF